LIIIKRNQIYTIVNNCFEKIDIFVKIKMYIFRLKITKDNKGLYVVMEIGIVKFFQSWGNRFLDVFFWLITKMGEETFFLMLLLGIYICYDKFFALKISFYYLISVGINNVIKLLTLRPRPHVASDKIINRLSAGGYSFPSGHTQGFFAISTTCMLELNNKNKNKKLKLSTLIILCFFGTLVMISRMYWGQHYLSDVVVGMMFGITIPFVIDWLLFILPNKFKSFFTVDKMFLMLGVLSIILFVVLLSLEMAIDFVAIKAYKFIAVFLAMSIGYIVDKKLINYQASQGVLKGLFKFAISVLLVVSLYLLCDWILPISGWICFVVYLFLGLVCTIILPLVYKFMFKKKV